MFASATRHLALLVCAAMVFIAPSLAAAAVNINTADAATLSRELKGIGMKRAQSIVDYRQKFGPFKTADDLALVKGISPAVIAKNREVILIDRKSASALSQKPQPSVPLRR
jgi:competence protein ComEA